MEYALIKKAIAPLMQAPPHERQILDEALCGMTVEVLGHDGAWVHIRTHYNYEGWVHQNNLCFDCSLIQFWSSAPKKVVLQAYADILDAPKVQGSVIGEATRGGLLSPLAETQDDWQKVRICDGREGWIHSAFLGKHITSWSRKDEPFLRKAFTKTALGYFGTQYRWGGKTPLGIDCSGLCSIAYLLNGVIICRDAHILPESPMHKIDFEDKKEGDLLFFPRHVAMYLGDNRYIHSTTGNNCHGVVINSLNTHENDYRTDLPEKLLYVGSIF